MLKQQVRLIYFKNRLKAIISFAFLTFMIVFTIIFFSIPQTKVKSMNYDAKSYGIASERYTRDDILKSMGISDKSYTIFLNANSLKNKLVSAPFVNDKAPTQVSISPFSFSVSFGDIFPVFTYNDFIYLSNGEVLTDTSTENESNKLTWARSAYEVFLNNSENKNSIASLNIVGSSSPSDIAPVISEIDSSFFATIDSNNVKKGFLNSITFKDEDGASDNGFNLHFSLKRGDGSEFRLNVITKGSLLKELTRARLIKGANAVLELTDENEYSVAFRRLDDSTRVGFFNVK